MKYVHSCVKLTRLDYEVRLEHWIGLRIGWERPGLVDLYFYADFFLSIV